MGKSASCFRVQVQYFSKEYGGKPFCVLQLPYRVQYSYDDMRNIIDLLFKSFFQFDESFSCKINLVFGYKGFNK